MRFRIRTLLIIVGLLATTCSVLAVVTRDYRKRRRVEADLKSMGAYYVGFDEDGDPSFVSFIVPINSSRFAKYKSFDHVDLSGAHVTDSSLSNLAGLERIGTLHLTECDVTDAHLQILANVGSIFMLRLNRSRITDGAIPAIASIKGLKSVDLSGTLVTDDGVAELERRCPAIMAHH